MKCIAISGLSGSGKTSLINALALVLPNAAVLSFDDYDFDQQFDNYYEVMKTATDYNILDLALFKEDILKMDYCDYLLLDYPFSYQNDLIKPFINLSVYLDTPFDIALSRRLIRDHQDNEQLLLALHHYLNHSRQAFVTYHQNIIKDCDVILDGRKDSDDLALELLDIIRKSPLI